MPKDDRLASKDEVAQAKRQLDAELAQAKREADDFQHMMEFLAPFFTDDAITVKQAVATTSSLLTEEIRSGSGKSAEELADSFLAKHYPTNPSAKLRQHYIKLIREQRAA